jgi:SWI/SNF-related matrix-associated actin-dependent regulator 1 of chromatin subfamily A
MSVSVSNENCSLQTVILRDDCLEGIIVIITSKYSGICPHCMRAIKIGDRICWTKDKPQGMVGVRPSYVSHALCSNEGRELNIKVEASRATDSDAYLVAPEGLEYLPFQKAGIVYSLRRNGTLLADEMGLGKTVQALGVMNNNIHIQTVLVVCPKSLVLNWKAEASKWLCRQVDMIVTNYEQLKKLPKDCRFDLMVIDEAQYIKNDKAQRTKLVKAIAKRCERKMLLTGTPILNRPVELWSLLQTVCPEEWDKAGWYKGRNVGIGEGRGFFPFAKKYCDAHQEQVTWDKTVWVFDGARNLDELNERLRSTCMIRRTKVEVLPDLPAKIRQTIQIEAEGDLAPLVKLEQQFLADIGFEHDDLPNRSKFNAKKFTEYSSIRHELAMAKVPAAVEHIKEVLEGGVNKLIVFAHHHDVIDALHTSLIDYRPVIITGQTPSDKRQACVDMFQNNETCQVIILSIHAAGVGLTLTAASHEVFVELDWTPAIVTQAEDRAHRIGQSKSVLVQHLVVKGSLDDEMIGHLIEKQEIADMALDIETLEDVNGREVVDVKSLVQVSLSEKSELLHKLRFLADRCDGALQLDGAGFNRLDSNFGKQLAMRTTLSDKQAIVARKMLVKYRRQLEALS